MDLINLDIFSQTGITWGFIVGFSDLRSSFKNIPLAPFKGIAVNLRVLCERVGVKTFPSF
jgi:hypothetical protein